MGRGVLPAVPPTPIRELQEVSQALTVAAEQRAHDEAERDMLLKSERAARTYAEAANKSKDEFLAMLGHELRNPLGAISNATAILDNPRTGEDMRQDARSIIARQVEHLRRLTDDLLDAARALTGKIVLERQPLELAALVAQCLRLFESSGRLRHHTLEQHLETVWIDADRVRVDQIFSNLLGNAIKYTPEGGAIRVSVKREGGEAVLRVADTGIGMTPELAARAFDLFVQGHRDLDRSLGGLGIGLTLVRRLAEMHGGWATVHSAGPALGAEFTVTIPAIEKPQERDVAKPRMTSAKGRDVLVVEDNDDARETLKTLLELAGHRVRAEADGVAGLEAALASKPDVMLVDIGLPKMDGYELVRRVRDANDMQRPFLVAVTGYGTPEDRQRALDAGFDAHLVKPVEFDQLQEVLERAAATTGLY
jgi:signal transduction histidine kinase/ActR/RegA family two-component response regulator